MFKSKSIQLKCGSIVTLKQIADKNAHGDVYSLTCNVHDRGWAYGRGDTSCKDALEDEAAMLKLATTFIDWVYRNRKAV